MIPYDTKQESKKFDEANCHLAIGVFFQGHITNSVPGVSSE
jgi:hypothetical protein